MGGRDIDGLKELGHKMGAVSGYVEKFFVLSNLVYEIS